jgi:hypothetical protein
MNANEKKRLRDTKTELILLGVGIGILLSFAPEPLLHALIYGDISSIAKIFVILVITILPILIFWGKRPFGITKKQAYRMFSIGISGISFILALITFLRYPVILGSSDYEWLVRENWFIGDVSMSSLVFFVASILWDTLIGSAFVALERLLYLD